MRDHSHPEQQILLLDAALAAGEASPDFELLLDVFDLPATYKSILARVLKEGSWRDSASPIETVWRATMNTVPRRATMRVVLKRDEEGRSRREKGGHSAETLGWLHEMAQTSELIRDTSKPGVRRQGGCREKRQDEIYNTAPLSMKFVPRELRVTIEPSAREVPDWPKIAERAGLDQWETKALQFMARGWTRYRSLKAIEDAADRRALEAAWRRLKRSNFEKVRTILVSP